MGHFSDRSMAAVATCEPDLQLVLLTAVTRCKIDFAVSQGHRTVEQQREYFKAGKSKLNPDDPEQLKKAMHLRSPSMAADIVLCVPGKPDLAYDVRGLCYVAGVIQSVAAELLAAKKIRWGVRWGGNWDGDGEIITDQSFNDLPHFELEEGLL